MPSRNVVRAVMCVFACLLAGAAAAAPCGTHASGRAVPETAARIANAACAEHRLWFEPFIDASGRLASLSVSEAEGAGLADGATPVWRRVAEYWQGSGLRWSPAGLPDGAACLAPAADGTTRALCRTFLVDTPWSAVFVSYVMRKAGLEGFRSSSRHVDYVRDAHRNATHHPYRLADPAREPPSVGDLLCFARVPGQAFGHAGFVRWLEQPFTNALAMHCDVVVATASGHARTIGGNVLQGVTMRVLPTNRTGHLWALPQRGANEPRCAPDQPTACNFNRQDWVALLKLHPEATSAPIPPGPAAPGIPCCDVCPLPMPAGMRRCPAPAPESPVGEAARPGTPQASIPRAH